MSDITDATRRVRKYRNIEDVCIIAQILCILTFAAYSYFVAQGLPDQERVANSALYFAVFFSICMVRKAAQVYKDRAVKAHPLYYLLLVKETFG